METIKNKVIYLFFTHVFLRRIGKRYPEFFKSWISDYIENQTERRVLVMRYTGDVLKDIAKVDKSLSAACYYDSMRGTDSDKKY